MGDLQENYQDLLDEDELYANDNQGLQTASTSGITEYTEKHDDAGDYFNGAIEEELGTRGNEHDTGPFDDPLLRDMSSDGFANDTHGIENSETLDIGYEHSDDGSEQMHDITRASTSINEIRGEKGGSNNGFDLLQGGRATTKSGGNAAQVSSHRHDLRESSNALHTEGQSLVGGLIWALVVVHIVLVLVLFAAWWRQKRSKDPTMRSLTPGPPQKVGCSYDMDKSYALPKIELGNLPMKALKTLKQAKA